MLNVKKSTFSQEQEITSQDYYFDSYAHFGIHEEMLKDYQRTNSYRRAILDNSHCFKGKVVLDVGCGTGILSMFAAKAGASHVYGIECSEIARQAEQIIEENGLSETISIIHGKVEEITLPVEKVDVIISEWMGYFLLFESMLDTVIYARDKWLAKDGLLLPDKATLYICALEDGEYKDEKIGYWDNVYGFKMSAIKELAYLEPLVDTVDEKVIVTDSKPVLTIDLYHITAEELNFQSKFKIKAKRDDYVHGFVAYFDCVFSHAHKPILLSTSPFAKYTHWKQTVFYTKTTLTICQNEEIDGEISCSRNHKNPRDLDINVSYSFRGKDMSSQESLFFRLR